MLQRTNTGQRCLACSRRAPKIQQALQQRRTSCYSSFNLMVLPIHTCLWSSCRFSLQPPRDSCPWQVRAETVLRSTSSTTHRITQHLNLPLVLVLFNSSHLVSSNVDKALTNSMLAAMAHHPKHHRFRLRADMFCQHQRQTPPGSPTADPTGRDSRSSNFCPFLASRTAQQEYRPPQGWIGTNPANMASLEFLPWHPEVARLRFHPQNRHFCWTTCNR